MNLKERREQLKLTQYDVAKTVGVSLTTYQLWERGVTTPKQENMIKLKKALELNETE